MEFSEVIEIVIGLVFIYLVLSLLSTTINELIFGLLHMRGKNLKKSLEYMLKDIDEDKLFKDFFDHPIFSKLRLNKKNRYPSYMKSSTFSKVIIESLSEDRDKDKITEALVGLKGDSGKIILSYWKEVGEDIEEFKKKLEDWFDEVQQRSAGWYKRNVQRTLIAIGFIIAIIINADTFKIVNKLAVDSKARKSLVELSNNQIKAIEENLSNSRDTTYSREYIESLSDQTQEIINEQLSEVNRIMGMGISTYKQDFSKTKCDNVLWCGVKKLFGLIITAITLSLGANFWFEILQKAIRLSGIKIDSKPKKDKNSG